MGLEAGKPLPGQPVDVVFIGSCTNSRITDLRAAPRRAEGPQGEPRACACWSCPARSRSSARPRPRGWTRSSATPAPSGAKPAARMCIAMNGDQLTPGQYARLHQQPQLRRPPGQGRAHLPRQPAHRGRARAVTGVVTDPRTLVGVRSTQHHGKVHMPSNRSRQSSCRSTTSTPTRSSRRAFSRRPQGRPRATSSSPTGATTPTARPKPDFVLNRPRRQGGAGPARRRQLRLRLVRASTRPGR